MNDRELETLACVGALTRESSHEIQNLLAVAGAWTSFRETKNAATLALLLDRGAEGFTRLFRLERALALCAAPPESGLRIELREAIDFAEALVQSRSRQLNLAIDVTFKADAPDDRCDGPSTVLAVTLVIRYAMELAARSPDRRVVVSRQATDNSAVILTINTSGTRGPDTVWSSYGLDVARDRLAARGGDLNITQDAYGASATLRIHVGQRTMSAP